MGSRLFEYASMACLFFFKRNGARRDRHSFPTRRSSDLGLCGTGQSRKAGQERRSGEGGGKAQIALIASPQKSRDRKSTRLNSSHPSTSYAVFCLKKKTHPSRHPASRTDPRHPLSYSASR